LERIKSLPPALLSVLCAVALGLTFSGADFDTLALFATTANGSFLLTDNVNYAKYVLLFIGISLLLAIFSRRLSRQNNYPLCSCFYYSVSLFLLQENHAFSYKKTPLLMCFPLRLPHQRHPAHCLTRPLGHA
jgi:hypothetical protein